ncbi:MAG: protein kinase, partial [Acidobacteriota bacterium]|nr:protein kinase [Acidobacteriota bacterium]
TGVVMGTVAYMSPEQARGLAVDARTDVWSLGCVLYEMVTGRIPFEGETNSDLIVSILEREPPPVARFAADVPTELERIITKTLRKDREERYQSTKDLALDLRSLKQEMDFKAKLGSLELPVSGSEGEAAKDGVRARREAAREAGARNAVSRQSEKTPSHSPPDVGEEVGQADFINGETVEGKDEDAAVEGTEVGAERINQFGRVRKISDPVISPRKPISIGRSTPLALTLVVIVGFIVYVAIRRAPLIPPRVLGSAPVTRDGYRKNIEHGESKIYSSVVTDGPRLFFREERGEHYMLAQASASEGETIPIPLDIPNPTILDISPNRSELLLASQGGFEGPLWVVPVMGGSPRRLGEVMAHAATWSPDGQQLVYAYGLDLFLARADGTEPRKLVSLSGRPHWPRFSPDGRQLRFTVRDEKTDKPSLWEVSADGTDLHPLLPGWNDPSDECCGNWTPDGRYYVFQSTRDWVTNVWALREERSFFRKASPDPVQLTFGPMDFSLPVPSVDGRRLFVLGEQERGELMRYDAGLERFVPHLSGISAEHVEYSGDGQWITYVTYPEGNLWRSRADGTERLQLASQPMRAGLPRWSPDGKRIAFSATLPGGIGIST